VARKFQAWRDLEPKAPLPERAGGRSRWAGDERSHSELGGTGRGGAGDICTHLVDGDQDALQSSHGPLGRSKGSHFCSV
jgi:hypothetical protein